MKRVESIVSDLSCWVLAGVFVLGLIVLAVRLWDVQIDDAADSKYEFTRQAQRRIQLAGIRGRILARDGRALADNRKSASIVCYAEKFQVRTWDDTINGISNSIVKLEALLGVKSKLTTRSIRRHVKQSLAMPLVVWRDVDHETLAKFMEHEAELPGFGIETDVERKYPFGSMASHALGYVGRDRAETVAGDEKFNFQELEMRGRSGLEIYYDSYLKGVPGESRILVDARGFAIREWTVVEPSPGPDLRIALDIDVQRAVEAELRGERGACVVMNPQNGEILAFASAPGYDPNVFVPTLSHELYERYNTDPAKPLLNRASGGAYAPGSTFKPIVALAGLKLGYPVNEKYDCLGVFVLGKMRLRCANRWGHGPIDMKNAIKDSCNAYFCNLGLDIGTNAIFSAARAFGLGEKTGIDLGIDSAGVVPDAQWKFEHYGERWFLGDVAQSSIGQGLLLVNPLQMARVAGAIGTGYLVVPSFRIGADPQKRALPFSRKNLEAVREGMWMVVNGYRGTGRHGGRGLNVSVSGKTGTAEIGRGEMRRKNTWFIAYAPSENPTVSIAMVIENGDSGGGTTAPKVRKVLAKIFGEKEPAEKRSVQ